MISFSKQIVLLLSGVGIALLWPRIRMQLNQFVALDNDDSASSSDSIRVFTSDELSHYNGQDKPQLYLSLLGNVSSGEKHYGKDGSYHYFTGKDASVAFISGEFEADAENPRDDSDVLNRLDARELLSLKEWQGFYDKTYKFLGRLNGRMYDKNGQPTEYHQQVLDKVEEAISDRKREERLRSQYPPCNIEWKEATGTRVWCTNQSGGIDRPWTGLPRKYFEVGKSDYRCACVPEDRLSDAALREYDDCAPDAKSCIYKV